MKTLTYSIEIDAPPRVVFQTMTDKSVYPRWAKAWGEGMTYEGDWQEGGHISFMDQKQGGTKVLIETLVPDELIRARHVAMVNPQNIEVELTDDMMRKWVGSREDYFFKSAGENRTKLDVIMETDEAFEPMMDAWPTALQYLKELCEGA